ncbi:MAG: MBL fold metallo-hydrolase [Nitrospinota bacterium]
MRGGVFFAGLAAALMTLAVLCPGAPAACKPDSLVRGSNRPLVRSASFSAWAEIGAGEADVTVGWFGHSFFLLASKAGTRIVTDPLAPGMYPTPKVSAHAVTIGREHRNHNALGVVAGSPLILRGLTKFGVEWRHVITQVREIKVRSIPVYQVGYNGEQMKGAAFTFDFGRVCVAHLGDLGGRLTPRQLEELGLVDVLLIPIGGRFTMGPEMARTVLRQVRPRAAIPMHFWDREDLLRAFLEGLRYRRHASSVISFTRESLPRQMTVIVLRPPA